MVIAVINILQLSRTHFVSNIRHQYQFHLVMFTRRRTPDEGGQSPSHEPLESLSKKAYQNKTSPLSVSSRSQVQSPDKYLQRISRHRATAGLTGNDSFQMKYDFNNETILSELFLNELFVNVRIYFYIGKRYR